MLKLKNITRILTLLLIAVFIISGCSDDISPVLSEEKLTDDAALKQLIEEDEAYQSFEPAYNEEDAMLIVAPKIDATIYPVRVGQRMRLTDVDIAKVIEGDTAFVSVTKYFSGRLFIAASYDEFVRGDSIVIDTLIEKNFETKITRNFKFLKIADTEYAKKNWKLVAISLPEGGTITDGMLSDNIKITRLTITLGTGEEFVVENPNEFYLTRGTREQIPLLGRFESALLTAEVTSAYEEDDFVTLTYGARKGGLNRAKQRFELISSEFDGAVYHKVYQASYRTHQFPGYFHAIINAIPDQVVTDDSTPVEEHSWGVPYRVN